MKTNILTVQQKINGSGEPIKIGETIRILLENLEFETYGKLYIREALSGRLFLSQRGHGAGGAGDICPLDENNTIQVSNPLFNSLKGYAAKAGALVLSSSSMKIDHADSWIWYNGATGLDGAILNDWFEPSYDDAVKACADREGITEDEVKNNDWYYIMPFEEVENEYIDEILNNNQMC